MNVTFTEEELKQFGLDMDIVSKARVLAGCAEDCDIYEVTADSFIGTTITIFFDETIIDKDFAEGMYELKKEIKIASVFYKTIEYWLDDKEFSKPYWMNMYGDILD